MTALARIDLWFREDNETILHQYEYFSYKDALDAMRFLAETGCLIYPVDNNTTEMKNYKTVVRVKATRYTGIIQ